MAIRLKLKHSATANKAPLPSDLEAGELALNTNAASPAAYIKDSAGNIVKLAGSGSIGGVDATTTVKGVVTLADAAAITAGTAGRVVTADQLKTTNDAIATAAGGGISGLTGTAPVTVTGPNTAKVVAIADATEAAAGIVELATAAETTAGTDATRAVHPAGLKVELDKLKLWARTGTTLAPKTAGDVVEVSAGTAALPGLTPVGDPNTGIWSPGADQLAISTGGISRVFMKSDGKVVIGGNGGGVAGATEPLHCTGGLATIGDGMGVRLLNWATNGGGYITADAGTNGGLAISSDRGPLKFRAGGVDAGQFTPQGTLLLTKEAASTAAGLLLQSGRPGDPSTVDSSIQFAAVGFESPGTTKIYSTGALGLRALCFATGPDAAGKERLRIGADGSVSIQQPTGAAAVSFLPGRIYIAGGTAAWGGGPGTNAVKWNAVTGEITWDTSTRLAKSHIEDCPYGVDAVKQLQPRIYTRKETGEKEIGFIADEVQAVIPEVVPVGPKSALTGNAEDTEVIPISVSYDKFVAVLTKALQEAMERIENLEAAVAALTPTP